MLQVRNRLKAAGLATLAASLLGCASVDFVKREVQRVEGRIARAEEGLRDTRAALEERLDQQSMGERTFRQRIKSRVTDLEGTLRKDLSGLHAKLQETRRLVRKKRNDPIVAGKVSARESVFFGFDSAALDPRARASLEAFLNKLRGGGLYLVEVAGHTDDRGPSRYNYRLGLLRAQAVARFLDERARGKVISSTVTYGKDKPLLPNANQTNRSKNRRVEVRAYRMRASSTAPVLAAPAPAPGAIPPGAPAS
ncbi:MAG: OmpA family protein [Nitrospinota bacterium]